MSLLSSIRSVVSAIFRRSQTESEVDEELHAHIQNRADDLEQSGLSRQEAERRARIEFGGHQKFKEESREAVGTQFIETTIQDVRYSLRLLRKSPSFTIAAVLTLALAIGANAVAFGALNGLILRPLNLPRPESLYTIERASDKMPFESYPNYLVLRDRNRSFDGLATFNVSQTSFDAGENATGGPIFEVSGNYFDVLGIQPVLGRFFHASDEHGPNSAPFAVISYAYWHEHFQEDRGVLGREVLLNSHPFTIIGVAPLGFTGPLVFAVPDYIVPIVNADQIEGSNSLDNRGYRWLITVGHLKAGVTPGQATADLNLIGSALEKTYPKADARMTFVLARPGLVGDVFGGPVKAFLTGLMLLAGLILLAACANLGSLFAARAADRSREVAVRLALGSTRIRILWQLFTEAVLISLLGGAAGLWGSVTILSWLDSWQPFPRYFPVHIPVSPDASVYAATLLLALASGFLFGAVPVRQVLNTNPYEVIKSASGARVGRRISVRDLLLGVQIAICAVLVTSSLVAVRGLLRSLHGNFGFEPRNTFLVETDPYKAGHSKDAVPEIQKCMVDAMSAIPGVTAVGLIDSPPLAGESNADLNVFTDETTDLRQSNSVADPTVFSISPDYFRAAQTNLLAGRDFTWHDDKNAPRVAVVNRQFVRKVFGNAVDGLGQYYKIPDGTRIQVVGIVEDGKYWSLTEDPLPVMFFPIAQNPSNDSWLVVRSGRDPQHLAAAMRDKLGDLDSTQSYSVQTWMQVMDPALFPSRVATVSLGILGVMGAMLSVTGIFGMAAYSVSKRKRELGIRVALGAQPREVLQAALGRAFKLLAFGSAGGLLLGVLASRVLASIVYQATPRDPLVLAGVVLAMMLLGLLATWIPARRALSISPLILMREE